MTYEEKCAWIALHAATPNHMTAQQVDQDLQTAMKHPIVWLFLSPDDLADATIRQIELHHAHSPEE